MIGHRSSAALVDGSNELDDFFGFDFSGEAVAA